jgi:hydrogenase maturation protease
LKKILIYGYGNPGRQDDGIGPSFVELVDEWIIREDLSGIDTDCNYQLNIEDSAVISEYQTVVFVDASVVEEIETFKLELVKPDNAAIEFTMHAVSPSFVVDLCKKIYQKDPEVYVLHIKGYEFDFIEAISAKAKTNLDASLTFLKNFIFEKIHQFK